MLKIILRPFGLKENGIISVTGRGEDFEVGGEVRKFVDSIIFECFPDFIIWNMHFSK
jgi:hypothetical protein